MILEFGRYTIDIDIEKTKAFYASNLSITTNEACSCDRCQRFPHAITSTSNTVLDFLHRLGIDPQKAGEVFGSSDEKIDHYSGWYHTVGTLLEGKVVGVSYDNSNAFSPDENVDFQVWFEDDPNRMGPIEESFPTPVLEMSFSASLPIMKNT